MTTLSSTNYQKSGPIIVFENNDYFLVQIDKKDKERAKQIPGRQFDWNLLAWIYPKTVYSYNKLKAEFKKDADEFDIRRPKTKRATRIKLPAKGVKSNKLKEKIPIEIKQPVKEDGQVLSPSVAEVSNRQLQEQHYVIADGATGYTYETIFRPYIDDAKNIYIEDPYIVAPYQVNNFSMFCALAVKMSSVMYIELITGYRIRDRIDDIDSRLETIKLDLKSRNIEFTWRRDKCLHDREVRFDNGWIVKIGRGLDIYKKAESKLSVSAADISLRPCLRTKVDVYRNDNM